MCFNVLSWEVIVKEGCRSIKKHFATRNNKNHDAKCGAMGIGGENLMGYRKLLCL